MKSGHDSTETRAEGSKSAVNPLVMWPGPCKICGNQATHKITHFRVTESVNYCDLCRKK